MSTLIDSLRIFACTAVFLGHTNFYWFFGQTTLGPKNGHDFVIVFFVLSGFVIAWSVDRKKNYRFKQYLFDRITRLWSVVIPALCIGYTLDYFGRIHHQDTYQSIFAGNYIELKFFISGFFLQECWFSSIRPGSNGPFWSLSYEFFYYLIFGSFILIKNIKCKLFFIFLFCLIAGPKILVLFPCWLMGCASYYCCKLSRPNIYFSVSVSLITSSILIYFLLERWVSWNPFSYDALGSPPLFYSAKYFEDFLTAFLISSMLYGLSRWFTLKQRAKGIFQIIIKEYAGTTFSLYAFHFPVIAFLASIASSKSVSGLGFYEALIMCLVICFLFALVFEKKLKFIKYKIINYFPKLN